MDRPSLKLISGGRDDTLLVDGIRVRPDSIQPFPVAARVFAEDCWLILSAKPELRESSEHPVRLMTDLVEQGRLRPGQVLYQKSRWLAVVHDLEQTPTSRAEWVNEALRNLLQRAANSAILSLGLPLLGSGHGGLSWQESLDLIYAALSRHPKTSLQRIWLDVAPAQVRQSREHLRHCLASRPSS